MDTCESTYTEKIRREINQTPEEYLPFLLEMIHLFRQSIALKPAEESLRQGWKEVVRGDIRPVSELWTGLDD